MKIKPQIRPLNVWIVGHPQNPLISETGPLVDGYPLAVFYKKKDAEKFRKETQTIYRVYKAKVIRMIENNLDRRHG
jgi:hypothetical protein